MRNPGAAMYADVTASRLFVARVSPPASSRIRGNESRVGTPALQFGGLAHQSRLSSSAAIGGAPKWGSGGVGAISHGLRRGLRYFRLAEHHNQVDHPHPTCLRRGISEPRTARTTRRLPHRFFPIDRELLNFTVGYVKHLAGEWRGELCRVKSRSREWALGAREDSGS